MSHSYVMDIELARHWDSTLTYDHLESPEAEDSRTKKIFVGRENMMVSKINTI